MRSAEITYKVSIFPTTRHLNGLIKMMRISLKVKNSKVSTSINRTTSTNTYIIQCSRVFSSYKCIIEPRSEEVHHKRSPNYDMVDYCPICSIDHNLEINEK